MKTLMINLLIFSLLLTGFSAISQTVTRQVINPPAGAVTVKSDLQNLRPELTPEFKVTVNTWSAGKISASQAVISYSIRIDDTTQPMEHGVCFSTSPGPTISNPKTTAKGYTTNTLYGELSGLKPSLKYYVKAYLKLLNYPDKIYYGNEISFTTLAAVAK